jgi:hypothetical protein
VQINVLPPKVSYTHPAGLTLDPSRGATPPGPREKPSAPQTEAPSVSVTSSIQSRTPAGSKLSTAQQLYAGAINKQKSSPPGPEASHGPKSPQMSLSPVPLALKHASSSSMSSPVFSFPDLSWRNAQQTSPTDLYNMAVVVQRGGATSSSRRANQDSGQLRVPSPPPPRSESVQSSSSPQDFPAQPDRASTLGSAQLDYLNRQNRNVVISKAPTIAMTAPPPSAEQKRHPDTLIPPPLYASSGPPPSAHYNTPVTFPPPTSSLLTAPISPPTYHQSGWNQQSLSVASHAPPTYHTAPDQTQYSALQVAQNQPPIYLGYTARPSTTPTLQTQTQAQPSQYQHQSQQMTSQNLIQSQVPPSAQQQGIIPDSRGHALQYNQPPDQTQPDPQGIAAQQHNRSPDPAQTRPQGYPPLYSQPLNQARPGPQRQVPQHSQPLHQTQLAGSQVTQPANQTHPGLQGQGPQYIQPPNQPQLGMQGHAPQHSQSLHQAQPDLQGHALQYAQPPHQAQPVPQGYASQDAPPNQVQVGVQGHAPQYSQAQAQARIQPQYSQNQGIQPQYTSQTPSQAQAGIQPHSTSTTKQAQAGIQPLYIPTPNQAQAGIQPQYSQAPNQVQADMHLPYSIPLQGAQNEAPTSAHQPIGGAVQCQGYTQQPQYHPPNQHGPTMPPLYQVQFVDIHVADYGEVLTDASVLPAYVSYDETQVTVVDTWCGDGQVGYDSHTIGVDGLGDSFSSLSIDKSV